MKKGYLCEDGLHLNIFGENIEGLYDEEYISYVEDLYISEIADKVSLDYSVFKRLKRLMISSLETYTFPKEICHLPLLEQIDCSGKCLIPLEIGEMSNLKKLDVTGDSVLHLPESIHKVSSLKVLTVSCYGDIAPCPMPRWITSLTQLEELYLHLCQFTEIDMAINNLSNLKTLCLWSSLSVVNDFPVITNLKKLKRLSITGSGFSGAPKPSYTLFEKVLKGIASLNTLTSLDLSDWRSRKKADYLIVTKKGKSIPDIFDRYPELESLDLSGMRIDYLPPNIYRLSKLNRINVDGNNLSDECLEPLRLSNVVINS